MFFFFPLSGLLDHIDHNPGFSGPTWILFPSAFFLLFNCLEQAPSPLWSQLPISEIKHFDWIVSIGDTEYQTQAATPLTKSSSCVTGGPAAEHPQMVFPWASELPTPEPQWPFLTVNWIISLPSTILTPSKTNLPAPRGPTWSRVCALLLSISCHILSVLQPPSLSALQMPHAPSGHINWSSGLGKVTQW